MSLGQGIFVIITDFFFSNSVKNKQRNKEKLQISLNKEETSLVYLHEKLEASNTGSRNSYSLP